MTNEKMSAFDTIWEPADFEPAPNDYDVWDNDNEALLERADNLARLVWPNGNNTTGDEKMTTIYKVCIDCLHVALYGNEQWESLIHELGEEEGTKRYEEISHSLESLGESVHAGDLGKYETFSRAPCECCGSTLGGSRYELVSIS